MIEHYRAWLQKKPDDRLALYGLALELKKSGDLDAAERAFEDLLALHPTSGAGWFQYGQLYEEAGDEAQAIEVWRRGLTALAGLEDAEARRSRGEIEGALAALE